LEPIPEQRERLSSSLGVRTFASAKDCPVCAGTWVWAVKPQVLHDSSTAVLPLATGSLHLSIVAGISTATLATWLGTDRIVRAMPNTPATIGAGVTAMLAMAGASAADRRVADAVFGAMGHCFWVDSDERIDAVTAVSGSGPGYVFEFLHAFQRAAEMLGFSETQARELCVRTTLGAAQQAAGEATALATLRDRVTSKGGTTEAGLKALAQYELPAALDLAVTNAYERARELSRTLSDQTG
jgi:pyrroline-5-carboxylate reductase